MRRLLIAALSALILLCTPFSDPQGCGLHSIRWYHYLSTCPSGCNGSGCYKPAASGAACASPRERTRRGGERSREYFAGTGKPSNESFPAVNGIPTRLR